MYITQQEEITQLAWAMVDVAFSRHLRLLGFLLKPSFLSIWALDVQSVLNCRTLPLLFTSWLNRGTLGSVGFQPYSFMPLFCSSHSISPREPGPSITFLLLYLASPGGVNEQVIVATSNLGGLLLNPLIESFLLWILKTLSQQSKKSWRLGANILWMSHWV